MEGFYYRLSFYIIFDLIIIFLSQYLYRVYNKYGFNLYNSSINKGILKKSIILFIKSFHFFIIPLIFALSSEIILFKNFFFSVLNNNSNYGDINVGFFTTVVRNIGFIHEILAIKIDDIFHDSISNIFSYFLKFLNNPLSEITSIIISFVFILKNKKSKLIELKKLRILLIFEIFIFFIFVVLIILTISGIEELKFINDLAKSLYFYDIFFLLPKSLLLAFLLFFMINYVNGKKILFKDLICNACKIKELFYYTFVILLLIFFTDLSFLRINIDESIFSAIYYFVYFILYFLLTVSIIIPYFIITKGKTFQTSLKLAISLFGRKITIIAYSIIMIFIYFFIINALYQSFFYNNPIQSIFTLFLNSLFNIIIFTSSGIAFVYFFNLYKSIITSEYTVPV